MSTEENAVLNTDEHSADRPLLLTAAQAAAALAICRTKVYELLRSGRLRSVQIGASRRTPAMELAEFVERLRTEAGSPANNGDERPTLLRRTSSN